MATHSQILAKPLACYIKSQRTSNSWSSVLPEKYLAHISPLRAADEVKMVDSWARRPPSLQSNLPSHVCCPSLLLAVMGCWGGQSPNEAPNWWIDLAESECGEATHGTRVVRCSDTQQLSQGSKSSKKGSIDNQKHVLGLRTRRVKNRNRNMWA